MTFMLLKNRGGHQYAGAYSHRWKGVLVLKDNICCPVACACLVSVPALALLGPEHVTVQLHEHVLGSLLDLAQVHLADSHHVLLVEVSLISEPLFCLALDGLAEVVDSDDLVPESFVFILEDFLSPSEFHQGEEWSVLVRLGVVVGGVILALCCRRWWQGPASRPGGSQEVPDQIGH